MYIYILVACISVKKDHYEKVNRGHLNLLTWDNLVVVWRQCRYKYWGQIFYLINETQRFRKLEHKNVHAMNESFKKPQLGCLILLWNVYSTNKYALSLGRTNQESVTLKNENN